MTKGNHGSTGLSHCSFEDYGKIRNDGLNQHPQLQHDSECPTVIADYRLLITDP